jgi:hypothetical protein
MQDSEKEKIMNDTVKLGPMVVIADKDMGWVNAEERMDWKFEYEAARLDAMYDSYEDEGDD